MGMYVKLGLKRALWVEWRAEWRRQKAEIEKLPNDWLIRLPLLQLIYTPEIARQG